MYTPSGDASVLCEKILGERCSRDRPFSFRVFPLKGMVLEKIGSEIRPSGGGGRGCLFARVIPGSRL